MPEIPGVLSYGATAQEAMGKAEVLALRARASGSHRTLARIGWSDVVFAFHEGEEIGPKMLARPVLQSIRG